MSQGEASVVQRALLTNELRRLRAAARLGQEQVVQALDWSPSKLIRIEGGTVGISTTDLKALLDLYGVKEESRIGELVELARAARTRGWWRSFKSVQDEQYLNYVGYESGASIIRQAQGLLVPGLLQTPDYAADITLDYAGEYGRPVEELVELRLERQERVLGREKPPEQFYVLDEAVIRRRVGWRKDRKLMPDQLRHLIEIGSLPYVTIQVIPFYMGAHFGLKGPFTLLSFDNELGDVLFLESAHRGDLTLSDAASAELITSYHEAFEGLRRASLSPEQSLEFIEGVATEMSLEQRGEDGDGD